MFDDAKVGTEKTITVVYTLEGANAASYTAPVNTILYTGKITKKLLLLTESPVVESKVYDGSKVATLTPNSPVVSGILDSDEVTVTAAGEFTNADAGNGKDVTVSYTLSGAAADNYSLASTTVQGNITAKQLTISTPTATKAYDGTVVATIIPGTVSGVVGQDNVQISATGTYTDANVGTGKMTSISYALSGTQAPNYVAPESSLLAIGTITAAPVTKVAAIQGTPKVGQTLTAGAVLPSGATVSYNWQSKNVSDAGYSSIGGGNISTYTPTSDDVGKVIRVVVTGNGNYKGSVASAPTTAITSQ